MLLHQANNSSMPEYDLFTWSAVGITVPVLSLSIIKKILIITRKYFEKKSKILLWDQTAYLSFRVN